MASTVMVAGARTPMGRFNGALSTVSATDLGGTAIRGALERAGVPGADVEYVIMGQVLQAGCGQIPARQAALAGGIPLDVPAVTINKVCLSGLHAIALADQLIRSGEFKTVIAGGMESMSRAPHLLKGSRSGFKYGDVTMVDHLAYDGLHDIFTDVPMGELTELANDREPITRQEQDAFAARSHRLAAAAPASRWDLAAKASCSWRVIGSRSFASSVSSPIGTSVKMSCSPSYARWSTMVTSPYLNPEREPFSRCGARDIDSIPPAITVLNSPERISWSASAIACSPDRHTLLIVTAGTSSGIPPASAACRAGICPQPACSTCPMITYSTSAPGTPARSSAPRIAVPPRFVALTVDSAPLKRPIGVLAPATITVEAM